MPSISSVLSLILLVGIAGIVWFVIDLRFAQRWSLKRAELGAQDKWRELNDHFESGVKCRRLMLRLFEHFVIPGLLEADYALHLSNQGEHERALLLAEKAVRKSSRRPAVQISILPAKATILHRMGKYSEARQVIEVGKGMLASQAHSKVIATRARPDNASALLLQEGLLELSLGNLDAALALGIQASAANIPDPARTLVSSVLTAMGRFPRALEALIYEPSGFAKFLKPEELDLLAEDKLFGDTAQKIDEELAGVFGPASKLGMALVFLEAGDVANLGSALEQTQGELKSHQAMEHIFVRTRACWHAMKGNRDGVKTDLIRAQEITEERPASRSAKYEYHLAAGRAYHLLGDYLTAIDELNVAVRIALHPMERHTSTYWLARAKEAADQPAATRLFEEIIADGIATWMEADSKTRNTRSKETL